MTQANQAESLTKHLYKNENPDTWGVDEQGEERGDIERVRVCGESEWQKNNKRWKTWFLVDHNSWEAEYSLNNKCCYIFDDSQAFVQQEPYDFLRYFPRILVIQWITLSTQMCRVGAIIFSGIQILSYIAHRKSSEPRIHLIRITLRIVAKTKTVIVSIGFPWFQFWYTEFKMKLGF